MTRPCLQTIYKHVCFHSKYFINVKVYGPLSDIESKELSVSILHWFTCVPFYLPGEYADPAVLWCWEHIIVHSAISVIPDIYTHLSEVKHRRVKCPIAQGHISEET